MTLGRPWPVMVLWYNIFLVTCRHHQRHLATPTFTSMISNFLVFNLLCSVLFSYMSRVFSFFKKFFVVHSLFMFVLVILKLCFLTLKLSLCFFSLEFLAFLLLFFIKIWLGWKFCQLALFESLLPDMNFYVTYYLDSDWRTIIDMTKRSRV